jgi:hypothetical protein
MVVILMHSFAKYFTLIWIKKYSERMGWIFYCLCFGNEKRFNVKI